MGAAMAKDENTGAEVERLIKRRRRFLVAMAFGFLAWQVGHVATATKLADAISSGNPRLVDVVTVAGFLMWAMALLTVLATGGRMSARAGGAVRDALEDELTQANRRAAFQSGYWALLFAVCALYALALFKPFTAAQAMPILIGVGVTAPILRFVALDRRGDTHG